MTQPPDVPADPPPDPQPPPLTPLTLAYATPAVIAYQSAAPRARVLVRWIGAQVVCQIAFLWPHVSAFLDRVAYARGEPFEADHELRDRIYMGMGAVTSVIEIVAVVYWLMWVHRTYRNLPALGADGLRFSPAWAVAYYFIPIAHLVRPFQVMRETWRASDPQHPGGAGWRLLPPPSIVNWWWGLSLFLFTAWGASMMLEREQESPWALVAASSVDVLNLVVGAGLLVLEMQIVEQLTELQELRAGRVGTVGTRPGEPWANPQ